MAQKTVNIDGLGEVTLVKRRGARNYRISLRADGRIRVSMPYWLPYQAGVVFAREHRDWVGQHQTKVGPIILSDGQKIGKAHRLSFETGSPMRAQVTATQIKIRTPCDFADPRSQDKAKAGCETALRREAEHLLPQRLAVLAAKHGFTYQSVGVRKMVSRWGSCSSKNVITLSYYLMQLPWELIDYVLLHELVHTRHMNHGPNFWTLMEELSPGAKAKQKQIRSHRPRVEPWTDLAIA